MPAEQFSYISGGFHPVHLDDTFKSSRYKVLHKLGHGGFATVWLARDSVRSRYVALKIMAARLSGESPEVQVLRKLRRWTKGSSGGGEDMESDNMAMKDADSEDLESPDVTEKEQPAETVLAGRLNVMKMLAHFTIHGPNGRHLCVVTEVGGPSIKHFNESPGLHPGSRRLRGDIGRKIALQAAEGLSFIHATGTIHGDFTAANILLRLANISDWTLEEIYERFGKPEKQKLEELTGTAKTESQPDYIVKAVDMNAVDRKWLSDQIMIIDFGISVPIDNSSNAIGTPRQYCAPELEFDEFDYKRTVYSDIWALGCTVFEIRTGAPLFRYGSGPSRDQVLTAMVRLLGSLPSEWWDVWEKGRHWHELESMSGGQLVSIPEGVLHNFIMETGSHDGDLAPRRTRTKSLGSAQRQTHLGEKETNSGENTTQTTRRLLKLVDDLTTSEAAEILGMLGERLRTSSSEGHKHFSPNKKVRWGSETRSESGNGSGNASSKSTGKSTSSEGVSSSVSYDIQIKDPADFLEPAGTIISVEEADSMESLLRKMLAFEPTHRPQATELAKHAWFTGTFKQQVLPP